VTSDRPPQVLWVANYVSVASNLTQMPLCLEVQTGGFGIVQNGAGGFNFLVVIGLFNRYGFIVCRRRRIHPVFYFLLIEREYEPPINPSVSEHVYSVI
jgi:hypothetical protein